MKIKQNAKKKNNKKKKQIKCKNDVNNLST